MPRKRQQSELETTDYRQLGKRRRDIPPAKIDPAGEIPKVAKPRHAHSPHLPLVLRFDATGQADEVVERGEGLLAKATKYPLTPEEASGVREALPNYQPWLEWTGKREQHERGCFEVDPIALHIDEQHPAQALVCASAIRPGGGW